MSSWWDTLLFVMYSPNRHARALGQWKSLSASQWLPREKLDALQMDGLARLLGHARGSVPYYARSFAGMDGDGSCREVLSRLPILTKEDVRANGLELRSRDRRCGRLHLARTGGSTGEPLTVGNGAAGLVAIAAAMFRSKEWAGLGLRDRGAALKAHGDVSRAGRLRGRLINFRPFGASLSPEHLRRTVIPALKACPPTYLMGYPTSLLGLARLLEDRELPIPVLFSTGEMLYPDQRKSLERTFGGRVYDSYGSNEVSAIAFECEHGRKHVTEEQVVVEVVDDAGRPVWDAPGRILVTDLRNLAMPFIRYELGDLGVITRKPCPCGRSLLVLRELEGRTQDAIRGPNGVALSGVFFAGRFRNLERIRAYQVVQTAATDVELRYVASRPDAEMEVSEMVDVIHDRLGDAMHVNVTRCEELALTRAGKTRLVVGLGTLDPAGGREESP
jgi:phenylacetate-CoA ligase